MFYFFFWRIQESPSSSLSSMYFQAAEVEADFRLLPQKCTDSYLQFAQPPPRRRNWSTNPWTTATNRDEMICTNTHYNSQKVRRHGAMSWRSEKSTSHAGKQTDVYRWSKHLTANWCYLMMFLPTCWWPSWPSWYIQGQSSRKKEKSKTVLMGRSWKQTGGARFSGCQQRVWVRGF